MNPSAPAPGHAIGVFLADDNLIVPEGVCAPHMTPGGVVHVNTRASPGTGRGLVHAREMTSEQAGTGNRDRPSRQPHRPRRSAFREGQSARQAHRPASVVGPTLGLDCVPPRAASPWRASGTRSARTGPVAFPLVTALASEPIAQYRRPRTIRHGHGETSPSRRTNDQEPRVIPRPVTVMRINQARIAVRAVAVVSALLS
jgi:hypothetical protein